MAYIDSMERGQHGSQTRWPDQSFGMFWRYSRRKGVRHQPELMPHS